MSEPRQHIAMNFSDFIANSGYVEGNKISDVLSERQETQSRNFVTSRKIFKDDYKRWPAARPIRPVV